MTLSNVIRDVINKETCLKMVPNCNAFVTLLGPDTKKTLQVPTNPIWTKPKMDQLDQIETNLKSGPTQNRDKPKEPKPNLAIYFMCYQVQLFRVQEF